MSFRGLSDASQPAAVSCGKRAHKREAFSVGLIVDQVRITTSACRARYLALVKPNDVVPHDVTALQHIARNRGGSTHRRARRPAGLQSQILVERHEAPHGRWHPTQPCRSLMAVDGFRDECAIRPSSRRSHRLHSTGAWRHLDARVSRERSSCGRDGRSGMAGSLPLPPPPPTFVNRGELLLPPVRVQPIVGDPTRDATPRATRPQRHRERARPSRLACWTVAAPSWR